ncbi:right-handed parallel beta-helix repeat-containing protein [Sphingobacterium sp. BIGb0165]|uniref:right-handed parallel beta-helix repeat-containing protein n=1 Tax=Sphingobacterium sp. BIGb0165 TaxID=2940615 RepID=UPI002167F190|nr:right-handed parallel beta-helix repeat-containing protein [Sphingobacterium sp. BIGb0165]MCS4229274.1 hypothetical protein [Sphingobacterium sp. BIGb0165]
MANQFLVKDTMAAMKALSAAEITALQNGTYEGVQLLGYYQKGDTQAPINYYLAPLTPDPGPDDGGSVIDVNGTKLKHRFIDTVDVSYFGVHPSVQDNSILINKAINHANINKAARVVNYGEITVIAKTASRSSGCIELKSNVSFENYGMITLVPNALSQYAIIGGENISNFSVVVGRIIGDHLEHQGDTHEHGMGIGLKNASNFVIKDGSIAQCAGDGTYLYGDVSATSYNKGCYNGDIKNITCDSNRRNGAGLICCENIRVESCIFKNTSGKNPMAGMDIEPNNYQNCKNITVSNCEFIGNVNWGLCISTHETLATVDGVIVTNCKSDKIFLVSQGGGESTSMTKNVLFDRCTIQAENSYGINLINGVSAVKIENCNIMLRKTVANTDPCVGIRIFKSNSCTLLNNMITSDSTGTFGIQLQDIVNDHRISGNTVSGFTYGVFVGGGVNNIIERNYIYNIANRGIWNHSSKGSIDHNVLVNIGSTGIEQNGGSYNTISYNRCFDTGTTYTDNTGRSIYLNNSTKGNRVLFNSIQNDDPAKRIKYGIEDFPGTSENTIAWNSIDDSYYNKVRNLAVNKFILDYGTGTVDDIVIPDANDATSNLTLTNATKAKVNDILNQLKITGYMDRT